MEVEATIEYRKVRHLRLEYGRGGLKVIVPLKYTGNVSEVLVKHKHWILRRKLHLEKLESSFRELSFVKRTDQTLRILILALLEHSSTQLGVTPKTIRYRAMKSRWGSCSNAGVITFSTRLKCLPERLVAFVVHHEMVHLQVMQHNAAFWKLMADCFPDFKMLRQELRTYGMALE